MIDHAHSAIFIHIPRCAGHSIEAALGGDVKSIHSTPWDQKHGTPSDWEYPRYWGTYFAFAVVRNPWARAVSLYFWDYARRQRRGPNIRAALEQTHGDFAHFIAEYLPRFMAARKPWKCQAHWLADQPQYDYICRMETLGRDFAYLKGRLNLRTSLPQLSQSVHADYREYYDRHTKDLVQVAYARDIALLNYSFGDQA